VRQYSDYGPDVDVVQAWVLDDLGTPMSLRDFYPQVSREDAYSLWGFLCEQLVTAAAMPYGLRVEPGLNPKLGCWGPIPTFAQAGVDDDSATALILGIAIDHEDAIKKPDPKLVLLAIRSAIVAAIKTWVGAALAKPGSAPLNRN
jgi:hypothetical protein